MKQEEIIKAFNNRWRIKSTGFMELDKAMFQHIKDLCLDFFKTGVLIADGLHKELVNMKPYIVDRSLPEDSLAPSYTGVVSPNPSFFGFDYFWDLYDKKVGRTKCEKLWEKLPDAERLLCVQYIPLYKQAQPDKQYRKNPETFLRNKSWNDEIIFRNGTDKQQQQRDRLAEVANRIAEYTKDTK
jgi:hypothetical protein